MGLGYLQRLAVRPESLAEVNTEKSPSSRHKVTGSPDSTAAYAHLHRLQMRRRPQGDAELAVRRVTA
jgi:hypothetical protein